jgi:precorrin-6B methylase 2
MDVELSCRSSQALLEPQLIRDDRLFVPGLVARLMAVFADAERSPEKANATDWEERYHLSEERANLLRVLSPLIRGSVLEIGAECGALTRFLGESAANVIAIETDSLCRRAALQRCHDLSNVQVVDVFPEQFLAREKFDCIIVSGGPDRVSNLEQLLLAAAQLLKLEGAVILTASNSTALDLLAGTSANETGASVSGLRRAFHAAGLQRLELLYLYPGWRFPRLIIPAEKFCSDNVQVISGLIENQTTEHEQPHLEMLSKRRSWPELIANGAGGALAPAFAIVAYKDTVDCKAIPNEVIGAMVNVRRRRCFQKITTVLDTSRGLIVRRKLLHSDADDAAQSDYRQMSADEAYIAGNLLSTDLYRRLDKPGWTFEDLLNWARRYLDFLASHVVDSKTSPGMLLDPKMVDCTPFNIVVQADSTLCAFDLEWIAPEPPPVEFVFFRGLLYTFLSAGSVAQCGPVPTLVIVEIVRDLIRGLGHHFEFAEIEDCWEREKALQAAVVGPGSRFERAAWEKAELRIRSNLAAIDSLVKSESEAIRRLETANSALQRMQIELQVKTSEIDGLRSESAQLARKISIANRRIARQHARIKEGLKAARVSQERFTSAQTEIAPLRQTIAEYERQVVATAESLRERGRVSERLHQELSSQRTAAASWARQAAVARLKLNDIQQSISWKSTWPVRGAVRLLLGLRKNGSALFNSAACWSLIVATCVRPNRLRASRALAASGLFDRSGYLARYPDVAAAGVDPLIHYLAVGEREARAISPLFDEEYYGTQNPPLALRGLAAVSHFLKEGGQQGRSPSKYFDAAFYLRSYPDATASGVNPLVHYLRSGAWEGANPTAWFNTAYYIATNPDLAESGTNPLLHYATVGERESRKTSAPAEQRREAMIGGGPAQSRKMLPDVGVLFDREYYLAAYPEAGRSGMDPLDHFICRGASQGFNPHPLFHTRFYLDRNEDVRKSGANPLLHFLSFGAWEGRSPNPIFDCAYYLTQYPDVKASGLNPLVHYLLYGAAQGRNPNKLFLASEYLRRYPESAGMNPLVHYFHTRDSMATAPVESSRQEAPPPKELEEKRIFRVRQIGESSGTYEKGDIRPLIVCISHVPGYPPRAGNDYRIFRMLTWLERRGYRVVMLIAPLPGETVADNQITKLSEKLSGAALCDRSGRIGVTASLFSSLRTLDGCRVNSFAEMLGEEKNTSERDQRMLEVDRTFCHDTLIAALQEVRAKTEGRWVLLCEYIFMSRVLPLLSDQTFKMIDTIDVFSTKSKKVVQFGINDSLALTADEERARLIRADLVIAIQSAERDELAAIVPERPVVSVGVDFDVARQSSQPEGRVVFYVASDNAMNVKGLSDFLRLAWPWIRREVPDATLKVAGKVCRTMRDLPAGVVALGPVDDVAVLYQASRLSINPAIAGTGLKIKTVESLCYLRPIVCWPSGVDGMQPELAALCFPVTNWRQFARRTIEILRDSRQDWYSPAQVEAIQHLVSPEYVYGPLEERLKAFFEMRS